MSESPLPALIFISTFLIGVGCSLWVLMLYARVAPVLPGRDKLVLALLVGICFIVTAVAGYIGTLSVRRLAGFPPFEWSSTVSFIVAEVILLIPLFIAIVLRAIRVEDPDR